MGQMFTKSSSEQGTSSGNPDRVNSHTGWLDPNQQQQPINVAAHQPPPLQPAQRVYPQSQFRPAGPVMASPSPVQQSTNPNSTSNSPTLPTKTQPSVFSYQEAPQLQQPEPPPPYFDVPPNVGDPETSARQTLTLPPNNNVPNTSWNTQRPESSLFSSINSSTQGEHPVSPVVPELPENRPVPVLPKRVTCPRCTEKVTPKLCKYPSIVTHLIAITTFLLLIPPLVFLPYALGWFSKKVMRCPTCGLILVRDISHPNG